MEPGKKKGETKRRKHNLPEDTNGSGQNMAKGVPFCDNVFLKMVSGDAVSTIFLQPTAQSDFLSAVSTSKGSFAPQNSELKKLKNWKV